MFSTPFKKRLKALGHSIFYITMRLLGHRGGMLLLHVVVFVYTLFSRSIHRTVYPYVSRRFPDHGFFRRRLDVYRNILSFGRVLVDRGWLGVNPVGRLEGIFNETDVITDLVLKQKGVVMILAHVGNWQTALADLGRMPVRVNALMLYDQEEVSKHYFDLRNEQSRFNIIKADGELGGLVEATAALSRGEIVTIMGDRMIKGAYVKMSFLGDTARFPVSAYMLAACTGAPVVVLFAARVGDRSYSLKVMDLFYPEYCSREERNKMFETCASRFVKALEDYLRIYPYQWYNFYDFWKQ